MLEFLGVVLLIAFGVPILALPHVLEGIVHLYLPPTLGWLAFFPLRPRELPEGAGTRTVADGYRSVHTEKAPGFETGVWVVGPADAPHSRVTVTSPRSAFITVMAKPRGLLKSFPHALATVRVRCADGSNGRRLEARMMPSCWALPLSIPGYPVLAALISNGGRDVLDMLEFTAPFFALTLAVWAPLWWLLHRDDVRQKTDNALEFLEKKIVIDGARTTP